MYKKKNLSPQAAEEKIKKLSQSLRAYSPRMHEATLLKFGICCAEGGGCLQKGSTP